MIDACFAYRPLILTFVVLLLNIIYGLHSSKERCIIITSTVIILIACDHHALTHECVMSSMGMRMTEAVLRDMLCH